MKILGKAILIMLILGGIVFWMRIGVIAASQTKTMHVTGHVEDARTGERIHNAKVIATAWDYGVWDASPHKYGTLADSNGQFTITATTDFWIARVDICASSPNNRYDAITKLKGYAPLAVRELAYWQTNITDYSYESFSGQWVGRTIWIDQETTQPAH